MQLYSGVGILCLVALFSTLSQNALAQGSKPPAATSKTISTSQDLEADLLKERDRAEFNLNLAKRKLEKNSDALLLVKQKYIVAWRTTNLLIEDIQESIKADKKPARSKLFSKRAKEAQEALVEFNTHVETTLLPADKQPKFLPVLLPIATSLVEMIWNRMSEGAKLRAEERKAQREELAGKLDSSKFREYDKVPQ